MKLNNQCGLLSFSLSLHCYFKQDDFWAVSYPDWRTPGSKTTGHYAAKPASFHQPPIVFMNSGGNKVKREKLPLVSMTGKLDIHSGFDRLGERPRLMIKQDYMILFMKILIQ